MQRALLNKNTSARMMEESQQQEEVAVEEVPHNNRFEEDYLNECLATSTPDVEKAISFLTRKDVPPFQKKESILFRNMYGYTVMDWFIDLPMRAMKLVIKYGGQEAVTVAP
jgi:hypothetical protein